MAIYQRIFILLLAGLQCSFVMADTLLIDDFSTNLLFRNQDGLGGPGAFGIPTSALYQGSPDYQINLADTNTALWQDSGSGIISTTRKGFASISSIPDSGGYFIINGGLLSANTDDDTSLSSLQMTYQMPLNTRIDMSDMSYFVIQFESLDATAQSHLRVALSVSDSAIIADAVANPMASFSNQNLVVGSNSFDMRGAITRTINLSQVSSISISISSNVSGAEFRVDSFSLAPIPEPSPHIALAVVLAGCVLIRRLRRTPSRATTLA